jgi:hypothetical protein
MHLGFKRESIILCRHPHSVLVLLSRSNKVRVELALDERTGREGRPSVAARKYISARKNEDKLGS